VLRAETVYNTFII